MLPKLVIFPVSAVRFFGSTIFFGLKRYSLSVKTLTTFKMAVQKISDVLFVLNPISGDIEKEEALTAIDSFCADNAIKAWYFNTTGENDKQLLETEMQTRQYDAVFAVGGDGTVHLAASVVMHSEIPLGILPMGSGNGLSKDVGIPQELPEALHVLLNFRVKKIDTLTVNNRLSIHLSDLGFNAMVVKLFSEGTSRGPGAYVFLAMQEYLTYEPKNYRIETDTENFSGPAFMVTIANANAFGSNAKINPNGIVDDGKFEICIIEPFPKTAALNILYQLYNDSIQTSVYSKIISCRQATIHNIDNEVGHVDGEPANFGEMITVKILPKSLHLLLPKIVPDAAENPA